MVCPDRQSLFCRHYAKTVFLSTKNHSDMAVLQLEVTEASNFDIPFVNYFLDFKLTANEVKPGDPVLAIGHGLLTPNECVFNLLRPLTH